MRKHIHNARDLILPVIDFFYPLFRRFMSLQTFRYAACGGINTIIGLSIYYFTYVYFLDEKELHLGFYAFKAHSAALFIAFCVSFPLGFFLSKYIVFSDSNMRGKVQLVRYFVLYLFNLALNYILLKIFVEYFHLYAPVAQIITTFIIVLFSYLAQRHFTFKVKDSEVDPIN